MINERRPGVCPFIGARAISSAMEMGVLQRERVNMMVLIKIMILIF